MDVVMEVRDARIPMSTGHPQMDMWIGNRKIILVLNREDMISTSDRNAWAAYFAKQGVRVVFSNGKLGLGSMKLNRRAKGLLPRSGFMGLSGAILIQVYQALFSSNPSTFLLILALLPTIVSLLLMCVVTVCPGSKVDDKKYLNSFSVVALLLAAYLMVIILSHNIFVLPTWAHLVTFAFLVILILSPLKIAVEATRKEKIHAHPVESSPRIPRVS